MFGVRFLVFACLAPSGWLLAETPLTLEDAVRRAVANVERQNTRLAATRASLQYLDAQSRMHWEFRPQLGLFSFSNPALLATSLGLGLLPNKGQSPSAWTWQNARLDEVDAEIEGERSKLQARLEAARRYTDVAVKQRVRDQLAEALEERRKDIRRTQELAGRGRVTSLTVSRMQAGALDLEVPLNDAVETYRQAVFSLAELIDMDLPEGPDSLELAQPDREPIEFKEALLSAQELTDLALANRKDLIRIRSQIQALEHLPRDPKFRFEAGPLNFARIANEAGGATGPDTSRSLLGGNSGTSTVGLSIKLSSGAEGKALAALTEARAQALRNDLEKMENSVRSEVRSLRYLVQAGNDRVKLAQQRVEISGQLRDALKTRERQGLETPEAGMAAENDLLRVKTDLQAAQGERRTRLYHLRAICGAEVLEADRVESARAAHR